MSHDACHPVHTVIWQIARFFLDCPYCTTGTAVTFSCLYFKLKTSCCAFKTKAVDHFIIFWERTSNRCCRHKWTGSVVVNIEVQAISANWSHIVILCLHHRLWTGFLSMQVNWKTWVSALFIASPSCGSTSFLHWLQMLPVPLNFFLS